MHSMQYSYFCDFSMNLKLRYNKTGVINDPLGQSTVLAGSDSRLIWKFWDVRTLCVKIVITTDRAVVGLVDQLFWERRNFYFLVVIVRQDLLATNFKGRFEKST